MRNWFRISLAFMALAATIGALLRLIYVVEMPWLFFKPWLHAHSHVAMLGWLFPGLLIALLGQDRREPPRRFAFWLGINQLLVFGMLVSFPLQGYGAWSISFSAAQTIVGYALMVQAWRRTSHWPPHGSRLLARLAFGFQVISTFGVWAMGPIMSSGMAGSELYYWSIQWFLHFQFNGWFWFAAMAIGSRWAEKHGVAVQLDRTTTMLWVLGTIFSFALAIAWSERLPLVFAVNAMAVLVQFWAAWRTLLAMRTARPQAMVRSSRWMRVLIAVMLLSMAVKIGAQAMVAIPAVAKMSLTLRNYVIGFVHLNTLGTISALLFAFALMQGWFDERRPMVRRGLVCFIIGYGLSEFLLFTQGTFFWAGWGQIPGYLWSLFIVSAIMALGVWVLLFSTSGAIAPGRPTTEAAE